MESMDHTQRQKFQFDMLNDVIASFEKGTEDGWTPVNAEGGVSVLEKKLEGKPVACGVMEVKAPSNVIFDVVWTEGRQPEYDDKFDYGETIETISESCRIQRQTSKRVALVISPRETIVFKTYRQEDDGYLLAFRSIDLPQHPPNDKYVRCELKINGYRIREIGENLCIVYHAMATDAGGYIPARLAGMFVHHLASRMVKIRALAEEV